LRWIFLHAVIAKPFGQILLAPAPILLHRLEGSIGDIVQNRFVGLDEGIAKALLQRTPRRRLKFRKPIRWNLYFW